VVERSWVGRIRLEADIGDLSGGSGLFRQGLKDVTIDNLASAVRDLLVMSEERTPVKLGERVSLMPAQQTIYFWSKP